MTNAGKLIGLLAFLVCLFAPRAMAKTERCVACLD
jgi:hypothetical protein